MSHYVNNKVVIISNSSWNIINFRKGVVLSLIDHGYDAIVVAPKDKFVSDLQGLGCSYLNVSIDNKGINPLYDLYLILQYLNIFRNVKPDVILSYTVKPNIYGSIAASVFSIPIVSNISGLGTAFIRGGVLGKIVSILYKFSLKKSKRVFFQNNDDKELFLRNKLVSGTQVDTLPGSGVNLEYFKVKQKTVVGRSSKFVFLLIARLIWDKGIQEYIDAIRLIKEYNLDVRFQILGFLDVKNATAVSRDNIDLWVSEGIVEYLGVAEDVRPFIEMADCVVLPSYREGVPKTLLEAAAMGKPIIATDVEGCRDVVDNNINGYLCNVRDYQDLASKMGNMANLNNEKIKSMGDNSRKKMEFEFNERFVIDKYLSILDEITASI